MEIKNSISISLEEKLKKYLSLRFSSLEEKFKQDLHIIDHLKDDFYIIANDLTYISSHEQINEYKFNHLQSSPYKPQYELKREATVRELSRTPNKLLTTMAASPEAHYTKIRVKTFRNDVKHNDHDHTLHEVSNAKTRNQSLSREETKKIIIPRNKGKNASVKKSLNTTTINNKHHDNIPKENPLKSEIVIKDKQVTTRKYSHYQKNTDKKRMSQNLTITDKHLKNVSESDKKDCDKKGLDISGHPGKIGNSKSDNKITLANKISEGEKRELDTGKSIDEVQPFNLVSSPVKEKKMISNGMFENLSFLEKSKKFLSIFCNSRYLSLYKRINLISFANVHEEVKKAIFEREFDFIDSVNHEISKKIEGFEKDTKCKELLMKSFILSKTSLNGLNLLNKDEDMNLLKYEQKEEVLNVVKLLYLFLNEDYSQYQGNKLIENLLGKVCEKHKATSLKMLILNNITKGSVRMDQFNKINYFIENHPTCLNSVNLIKINKAISYITFTLKDLYEFLQMKTEDGTYIIWIRELKQIYQENVFKLGRLKLLS